MNTSHTIKTLAKKIAPDYPYRNDIMLESEYLWAIESAYEGTNQALEGAHRVINDLASRLDLTPDDVSDLWLRLDATELHAKE